MRSKLHETSPINLTSCLAFLTDMIKKSPFSLNCLAELKCIRSKEDDGMSYAQDLAKSQRYSLQLERQLRELLQSPQGSGKLAARQSCIFSLEIHRRRRESPKARRSHVLAS